MVTVGCSSSRDRAAVAHIRHVPEPEIDALTLIPGDWVLVIVALTLYTLALLVRAVPEALDAVSPAVLDSATAVGYKPLTPMLKIELPLALPVLIASLRVVAVTNISMVAVGSVIGIGGLSTWFTEAIRRTKVTRSSRASSRSSYRRLDGAHPRAPSSTP